MIQFDLTDRETIFSSLPRGGVGAEIGVDFGEFSKVILRNAEPRLFYLVDCWVEQPVEVTGHDPANYRQEIKDAAYRHAVHRQPICRTLPPCGNVQVFQPWSS